MSVIEGTWTTPRAVIPSGPMMVCTDGVVTCTGGAENSPGVKAYDTYGNEVDIPEYALPAKYKNMPSLYAEHVKTGEKFDRMFTIEENVRVMAILDAAIKASESGKSEKIPC